MTTQEKREALAQNDAEVWDFGTTYDVAIGGCEGYNNMIDEQITQLHNELIGEATLDQ